MCGFICVSLYQSIKIKPTNINIDSARAHLKINTHTCVEIDTCVFQAGCQLPRAASGMLLWLCYWHTSSGLKRTCWTTASWRWCLGLEVVSSIPTGSTKIYRFLHGCLCVSLCQNIKTKPINMYIASARAQFKIKTHGCWNWPLCIPDGLSVVQCSLGHVIGIVFLHNFCGMKWTCWTHGSWQCCPSLEVVSLIPTGSTIIYRSFVGLHAFSCARASIN